MSRTDNVDPAVAVDVPGGDSLLGRIGGDADARPCALGGRGRDDEIVEGVVVAEDELRLRARNQLGDQIPLTPPGRYPTSVRRHQLAAAARG
ncbi:MAG: hypothetical protein ACREJS_08000, partial [Candidatus Rokuibacteriota bacterium]